VLALLLVSLALGLSNFAARSASAWRASMPALACSSELGDRIGTKIGQRGELLAESS
jgi:hypothetical protein